MKFGTFVLYLSLQIEFGGCNIAKKIFFFTLRTEKKNNIIMKDWGGTSVFSYFHESNTLETPISRLLCSPGSVMAIQEGIKNNVWKQTHIEISYQDPIELAALAREVYNEHFTYDGTSQNIIVQQVRALQRQIVREGTRKVIAGMRGRKNIWVKYNVPVKTLPLEETVSLDRTKPGLYA